MPRVAGRCLWYGLLAASAAWPALAQSKTKLPIEYAPELWKIGGGDGCIYLLGSIHVGTKAMYPLPQPIEEDFAASRTLLLETYVAPGANTDSALDAMVERVAYPEGDSLWKHIDPDVTRRIKSFLKKNKKVLKQNEVDVEDVGRMRP